MDFRSTNDNYVHFQGDIVSNVNSSHGVHLRGGSTGGIIQPASDDTAAALNIRAKGATGVLNLGTSTGGRVNLASTGVTIGSASTTPISAIQRYVVQFTAPTLSSGIAEQSVESTYTVSGLSTGTVLIFTPTNPVHASYTWAPRCSTADELHIRWGHFGDSTLGSGESSNRGVLLQFTF